MISYPNVKLNLGLNVLRKRPDGYHDLETLFIPCHAFNDVLEIVPNPSGNGARMLSELPWGNDLTLRAYQLLAEDYSLPPVDITLRKGSPVGAGLGGGSADAAFALHMLNGMSGLSLDESTLASYASRLGSDCPFFIYNRPMFGEGRGEILSDFEIDLSAYEIKVAVPQAVSVSTKEAYGSIKPHIPEIPLKEVLKMPVSKWRDCLHNDFEDSVFPIHPEIAALKQEFYDNGAVYAAMSGSGSAVFGLFGKGR